MLPKVHIVILNWNGVEDTINCLESLNKITYPNYEVIVVDNASEEDDVKVLKERYSGYISIIENERNLGYAEGNNVGIRFALEHGTDYVMVLNNDTIVDSDFLSHLVESAEKDSGTGLTGPKMFYMDQPDILYFAGCRIRWFTGLPQHRGMGKRDNSKFDTPGYTDALTGSCMLIKRVVFEKIGLLPTDYFLQWEDMDFSTNARGNGFRCLYVPQAKVWHRYAASFTRSGMGNRRLKYGVRAQLIYWHKYLSRLQFFGFVLHFIAVLTPLRIILYLLWHNPSRINHLFQGIREGFTVVFPRGKAQ